MIRFLHGIGGRPAHFEPLAAALGAAADLAAFSRVEICGDREHAISMARAMICSATAFQTPDQLLVAVLCSDQTQRDWDWLKWLPQAQSPVGTDAIGPERLVATSVREGARAADALVPEVSGALFASEDLRGAVRSFLADGPGKATYSGR